MSGGPGVDEALERRLAELETRLAFQEHALLELSDALAQARQDSARGEQRLQRALSELRHAQAFSDAGNEPPPPHY
jgi:SlyX protein